jgi:hypothetical protein
MGNRLIRRDRKTVAEERVRAMMARRDVLWRLGRDGRLRVPLAEPFLWGYRRELVLRLDVARRRDADTFLQLLELVQKVDDCKRKDFMVYDKQACCWYKWQHKPKKLSLRQYNNLPSHLQRFFHLTWNHEERWRYQLTDTWMFVSKRSKLYITHRFVPDTEVEQELHYLSDRILQNQLEGIANKVKSGRNRWKKRRRPIKKWVESARIHRKEIGEAQEWHAQGKLDWARGKEVNEDAKA